MGHTESAMRIVSYDERDGKLPLSDIQIDGDIQPRAQLDMFTIEDYADAMREGASFPPLVVFFDGSEYWLADGFHRYHAAERASLDSIAVDIREGGRREAILYGLGANATHGLRRTNADKRKAVETLLRDPEWSQWTDNEIARHTQTSQPFVGKIRSEITYNVISDRRVYTDRWGNVSTMQTGNIGQSRPESQSSPEYDFWSDVYDDESDSSSDNIYAERLSPGQAVIQSITNEWYTPATYIEAARAVMGGIDLDPSSCVEANETVQAQTFYTSEDDGLSHSWEGRVWLNPPYGRIAGDFVLRLVRDFENGRVAEAITLVNAHCTDTSWFQPLWDYTLCFTDHRINFAGGTVDRSGSTHGSVFVYLGPKPRDFARSFCQFGAVVRRWES